MNKKVSYKRAYKKSSWKRKLRVKINNILHAFFVTAMLIGFGIFTLWLFTPINKIEAQEEDVNIEPVLVDSAVEIKHQVITLDDEYYLMLNNVYPWEVCNLTFHSYKDGKMVDTPQWFRESLYKYHDCNDQLLLTKLAHYESTWNPNSVNPMNTYARGTYHVLPTTRAECSNKYGLVEESDCALWVIKNYPSWYLDGYRPYSYDKSF